MKILLTGKNGQLGRGIQKELSLHHQLIALDQAQFDISKLPVVRMGLQTHQPDLVINAAGYTNVDGAQTSQERAFQVNALGPRNLALTTAEYGIPLLTVSTDYVFDGNQSRPYHEFDIPNPLSVYGLSKLAGEKVVESLNRRHYIVRTSWLYSLEGKNFPLTMLGLGSHPEVNVIADQFGSPTYVPHLVHAIGELLQTQAYGTYHLAGQGKASWYDITKLLYQHVGLPTPVNPVSRSEFTRPAPRPQSTVLTTIQDPQILLPAWENGILEFSKSWKANLPHDNTSNFSNPTR